ncbi:MAG: flippase-like domain-containing protein [Caldilineaceae bacterium]|nr:flippase-like domain-containing protein [Caldilineaceae bacterium]
MRNRLTTVLKLAVSIGLLYYLFAKLGDPAEYWRKWVAADKSLLLLGALCYAAAVALSGLKWGLLLHAAGLPITRPRLLQYQWMAEFFNNFLPAQVGGDVMRGYALASDTHRAADAAASVLIDRFIGLMVFMGAAAVAAVGMLLLGRPNGAAVEAEGLLFLRVAALGSSAVTLLLLIIIAALLSRTLKQQLERLLARLPFSAHTLPIWQQLTTAFNVYRTHLDALVWTAIGSALIVVLTSINIWLIARAVTPQAISLIEVLAINPIIVFALLVVPLAPGGLGVRQLSFAGLFQLMGAGFALGTAVGLLQQLIGYVVSLPGGFLWLTNRQRLAQAHPLAPTLPVEPPTAPRPS